ncbi:MAG: hypothetical protein ACTSQ8_07890 [Candidatus Helarchaeota archaeon]
MSLDNDIASAIDSAISYPVFTTEIDKIVQVPMVHVEANTEAHVSVADLNMGFHRREKDFLVTLRCLKDADIESLKTSIETAIYGISVTNGWIEITGELENEMEKIHEMLISGKKIWWE